MNINKIEKSLIVIALYKYRDEKEEDLKYAKNSLDFKDTQFIKQIQNEINFTNATIKKLTGEKNERD